MCAQRKIYSGKCPFKEPLKTLIGFYKDIAKVPVKSLAAAWV